MTVTQEWRVGNDHRYQFVSQIGAERFARQKIAEQEHMTGETTPIDIACDGVVVATVRMDVHGRVWMDPVA